MISDDCTPKIKTGDAANSETVREQARWPF
jgi:hypothetical protein